MNDSGAYKVLVHIGFELADTLSGECMGNGLAFSRVFCPVSCVEETSLNGDEYIVVIATIR